MSNVKMKYFTPREAQKTLPLVKQIVTDIFSCANEMKKVTYDLDVDIENDPEMIKLSDQIKSYINELDEIGCIYKDWNFEIGLVDFPAIINGEEVLLCWRSDEETIRYYHNIHDGYNGRKLIPNEYL